jgi:hypothetical protein
MTKQLVFMSRPPDFDDKEVLLEWVTRLSVRLTGREPTPEEVEEARRILASPTTKEDDGPAM